MILYFAYGSNMDIKQIRLRIENNKINPIGVGVLKNYTLFFPRESTRWCGGVASIKEKEGEKVYGVIYELSEDEIKKLDKYEGFGSSYNKIDIKILKNNEEILCETYIAIEKGKYLPSAKYLEKIISGAKMNKLPSEYIEKLKKLKTREKI